MIDRVDEAERERLRLRSLHGYGVLDTPEDQVFDDITALAAQICGTPVSLISLVDSSRQWFKSHHGFPGRELPREIAFCHHTIMTPDRPMVVQDATQDPRFASNPLVTGEAHVRFYAAAPLVTPEGHALGTVCVLDQKPRDLSEQQLTALRALARLAMDQLELRRALRQEETALQALRSQEQRFESVARAVSDVIWDWNVEEGTLWWSEGFTSEFGYALRDLPGGTASWDEHLHPDDRARVLGSLHAALGNATTHGWQSEYRFQRQDGSYAHVQHQAQILRNEAGRALRVVAGIANLTERKRLEAQSLRAQRIESIGALAGGIAHDLNNILTPVIMSTALLQDYVHGHPDASATLQTIEASAMRAAELTRQILSFARGVPGVRSAMNIALVLDEAVRLARETFPRSIKLVVDAPPEIWTMRADPTHLHQVLMNLMVNARDAMPKGGVLSVGLRNQELPEEACAPFHCSAGRYVVLTVRDTGTGIAPDIIDRIFDPFFTTKGVGQGTGLGLSTVHGIVRSLGGFVRVESTPGAGSTFEVNIPAVSAVIESSRAAVPKPARGNGELLLLVDDETSIRAIAAQTLESHGYRVIAAENGRDALALYRARGSDVKLVFSDLMMPVMDGLALAQELLAISPGLPIVLATGAQTTLPSEFVDRLRRILPKPYTAEAMLEAVNSALHAGVP